MSIEKVNFSYKILKTTKLRLEKLKKEHRISTTDILDKVLAFDTEGLEFYIEIMNLLHNSNDEYNYIGVSNGGLIFNKDFIDKVHAANLHRKSLDEIKLTALKQEHPEVDKHVKAKPKEERDEEGNIKFTETNFNIYFKRTNQLFNLAAAHIREKEEFEKRISNIEKVLKKNGIEIEDI